MKSGRMLISTASAESFLRNCLEYSSKGATIGGKHYTFDYLVGIILDAESTIEFSKNSTTLRSDQLRNKPWNTEDQREHLRRQIVAELFEYDRPKNEDDIKLGFGGAHPPGGAIAEKKAYLVTGLPASGKSTIVAKIADTHSAYVVDSDYAKRKLPEFGTRIASATLVHEESSFVTIGSKGGKNTQETLLAGCLLHGFNIVRPMIGDDFSNLESFRELLVKFGYEVHLTIVDLDRRIATERALGRFLSYQEKNRYVPLSYIFDYCANNPSLFYYKYRVDACNTDKSPWSSLGAISTLGKATCIDYWGSSNPAQLF